MTLHGQLLHVYSFPPASRQETLAMFRRILAIAAIFFCTSLAWAILGSTIFLRTESLGGSLSGRVASTWGAAKEQAPPEVQYVWTETQRVTAEENGKKITREE